MSVSAGQASVSGTVPVTVTPVPPGAFTLVMSTTGGTAYVGCHAVSTSNALPLTAYPVTLTGHTGSHGGTVYAAVAAGTVPVGWMLTTPA